MLKKLRIRFVCLAMTALFSLLSVIVAGMNIINYRNITVEADTLLSILMENKGSFPDFEKNPPRRLPRSFSPEVLYESRYFSVILDAFGNITETDTARIASVSKNDAAGYAFRAHAENNPRGFIDNYRFALLRDESSVRIVFLDWGRRLDTFHDFLASSILMSLAGLLIVFPVVYVLSGKILRPVSESYEKQRRFITDAGHEIKTPLTIINANADILEMELGENECVRDILRQTERLKSLTGDLVALSRMEEAPASVRKIEFPVSEVVAETAKSFKPLAAKSGKTITLRIEELLTLKGDHASVEKLVSILLDNAVKYAPCGSEIILTLRAQKNQIALNVSNQTDMNMDKEQLARIFDRFYRADTSRNSETGGHGIGLSMAHLIVKQHGGKIQASMPENNLFRISVTLPSC